jgi:hypothetical protein
MGVRNLRREDAETPGSDGASPSTFPRWPACDVTPVWDGQPIDPAQFMGVRIPY